MAAADASSRRLLPAMGAVAVDAMGGDQAPDTIVAGALDAVAAGVDVVLVGDTARLAAAVADVPQRLRPGIVHAGDAIGMDQPPASTLRREHLSVRVAARLVADGDGVAALSFGPTGAAVAAARLELGKLAAVRRPSLAAVIPERSTPGGRPERDVILIDAGAATQQSPGTLFANVAMGIAYARARGVRQPRAGLLNIANEVGKGHPRIVAAEGLLAGVDGFIGSIEPWDVLAGAADVVATDGFTGNVFLKTLEAAVDQAQLDPIGYATPRAAAVIGVGGTMLVGHGAAAPAAVTSAIHMADELRRADLPAKVAGFLGVCRPG